MRQESRFSQGYTRQSLSIQKPAKGLEKNVILAEYIYSLNEICSMVEGAEDPAYAVMRRAIANAPYYRAQVAGFTL